MRDKQQEIEDMMLRLERFRFDLMTEWSRMEDQKVMQRRPPPTYPKAFVQPLDIHGYAVFQFSYQGMLPPYHEEHRYQTDVRNYYLRATLEAYDRVNSSMQLERAAVYVAHYFAERSIRDLDNRNRKYLQDALRKTLLIRDDCWRYLSWLEKGYADPEGHNHVQMYVLREDYFPDFLMFMWDHHQDLIKPPNRVKTAEF